MPLALRRILSTGTTRAFTRNGVLLMVVYAFVSLVQGGFVWALTTTYIPMGIPGATSGLGPPAGGHLPLSVSLQTIPLGIVTGGLITLPVHIVAVRVFAVRSQTSVSDELVLYRLGLATLNMLLAALLKVVLLTIVEFGCLLGAIAVALYLDSTAVLSLLTTTSGKLILGATFVVLSLPAVYLALSLEFLSQEIALHDRNFVAALRNSWLLASGNRLRILALVLLPMGGQLLLSFLLASQGSFPGTVGSLQFIALQGTLGIEGAVVAMVFVAIMTTAYRDLRDERVSGESYGWETS